MKTENIYLIESQNRQNLAETFMRFQEYYESPVFSGRYFSVHEFAAWYTSKYGAFSYARDWSGFNIPSWVMEPFKNGSFGELTEKEQKLLSFFKNKEGNFYIIGATPQDEWFKDTVKHEYVHGAFFTSPSYKSDVISTINEKNPEAVKKALREMGYGEDVLTDEANAYLLTEPESLGKHISLRSGIDLRNTLDKLFKKHFGFSMAAASAESIMRRVKEFSI